MHACLVILLSAVFRHIGVHVLPVGGGQNAGGHCEIHPFYVAVFRRVRTRIHAVACAHAYVCTCIHACSCIRACAHARACLRVSPCPAGAVARGQKQDGQRRQLRSYEYFLAPIGKKHVGINSLIVRI